MSKKKVLVVDDWERMHSMWKQKLNNKVTILSAFTIEQAEKIFATNPDCSAIVIDACVPGTSPTTLPLVRKIRETFGGPMIAISGQKSYRWKLMQAGCDHESTKGTLPQKVLEVLGI